MDCTVNTLCRERILALDGPMGSVEDVYFDDARWTVRYLVVQTRRWLPGHRVLIRPGAVVDAASAGRTVRLNLTRSEVDHAPGVDTDRPVVRQHELELAARLGQPYYWSSLALWGAAPEPALPAHGDPHLRSGAQLIGYRVEGRDGVVGELTDFIVELYSWGISAVVIHPRHASRRAAVRLAPSCVQGIDCDRHTVSVGVTRGEIASATPQA